MHRAESNNKKANNSSSYIKLFILTASFNLIMAQQLTKQALSMSDRLK